MVSDGMDLNRRSFMKWSGVVAGSTALVGSSATMLANPTVVQAAQGDGMADADATVWSSCNINCGSRCPLRLQIKDGTIVRVLPDNTGSDDLNDQQLRACVRGRSMRQRVYSPDRIKKPMKRKEGTRRGDGQWEEIEWDEAIQIVGDKLKETIETYSNEAIYFHYGSGATGGNFTKRGSWQRFLAMIGGYLHNFGTYSTSQIRESTPYHYGSYIQSNSFNDAQYSKLQVMFGTNPVEIRMSGGGEMYVTQQTKKKSGVRTIVIDPRYSETALTIADEWVPIRPGTDAALVAAMIHVMITEGLHDQEFLDKYCVGFDEEHMPEGIPAHNSYRSYVEGKGADGIEKTPEWAAEITGIPAATIVRLAREIANAKPCAITQGWGIQRAANGENGSRAVMTLANVTGNVGIQGGGTGCGHGSWSLPIVAYESSTYYTNPVKTRIPVFAWPDAIDHGPEMTSLNAGIKGADRLQHGIKFMVNFSSNCLTNQHSDINGTIDLIRDESKCPFILAIDNMYVHSVQFADVILPDTTNLEQPDLVPGGYAGDMGYVIYAQKAIETLYDTKPSYEICAEIAKYLEDNYGDFTKDGKQPFADAHQRFTDGKDADGWITQLWTDSKAKIPELPSEEELKEMGVFRKANPAGTAINLKKFREDPVANPLKDEGSYIQDDLTKIHIFSKKLWEMSQTWELPEGDKITALAEHVATWESSETDDPDHPLQMVTHHFKGRTHSTYVNLPWIEDAHPQRFWINPIDAEARGIANGDQVRVFNDRGECRTEALVTPRIAPGVTSMPQGAWYTPSDTIKDAQGRPVDMAGSCNVLTKYHPSTVSKGNPQHTNRVQVEKV